MKWNFATENKYTKGLSWHVPGPSSLTPTLPHSLCNFQAVREFLGVVALGAPRSVLLCFLIWVRDPFPGDLDAGAGSLRKIAQGKPGMATFS